MAGVATVKASVGLNVRKGAGTNFAKIGMLSNGARVNYSAEKSGWLQIQYNRQTGYISKQYTSVSSGGSSGGSGSSAGAVKVTCAALNVRAGAGTGYRVIGSLSRGQTVSYSRESGGWLNITHNGKSGWISKQYTSKVGGASAGGGSTGGGASSTMYVNCASLNVRKGAGTGYARLGAVSYGTALTVYGQSNGWLQIKYGSGKGWVSKSYTSSKKTGGGSGGSGGSTGGAMSASARKVVNWANNHVGACYKRNGMTYCQGYVADCVQYGLGRSYSRMGSAEAARQRWQVSTNSSNIPAGAAVYLYSYTKNGRKYGHVGIHVGGNMICHVTGNVVKQSLSQINNSGWCRFRSWGWEGGIALK